MESPYWRPFAIPKETIDSRRGSFSTIYKETRTPKIYIVITKNYNDPGTKLFGFILSPVTYSLLLLAHEVLHKIYFLLLLSHSEMAPVALLLPTRGTSR